MTKLTVVMPVHNAMPFLAPAIESILVQTFRDFVFIIGDDGSTDGSYACMQNYAEKDHRIKLLRRSQKSGPASSSNWVANAAETSLVARMDGDDLASPERLEKQLAVLDHFANAVMVGSLFNTISAEGKEVGPRSLWRLTLTGAPPIAHPTIMYRKSAFDAIGGYATGTDYFEDYELYQRIATKGDLLIMPEALCTVRFGGVSARLNDDVTKVENKLDYFYRRNAARTAGLPLPSPDDPPPAKIKPDVLVNLAMLRVMSGQRPRIFPRLFWRAGLSWRLISLRFVIRALLTTIMPKFALHYAARVSQARNKSAASTVYDGRVYKWCSDCPPVDLGSIEVQKKRPDLLNPLRVSET